MLWGFLMLGVPTLLHIMCLIAFPFKIERISEMQFRVI